VPAPQPFPELRFRFWNVRLWALNRGFDFAEVAFRTLSEELRRDEFVVLVSGELHQLPHLH
jgi:hypothetical protein